MRCMKHNPAVEYDMRRLEGYNLSREQGLVVDAKFKELSELRRIKNTFYNNVQNIQLVNSNSSSEANETYKNRHANTAVNVSSFSRLVVVQDCAPFLSI